MPETQTTVDGLRAVELNFRPLRDIATGRSVCCLARTQLNTPGLGTLMPETFRPAAETYGKTAVLFNLEMLRLAESIRAVDESDRHFQWIAQDMPLSLLRDRAAVAVIEKICERFSFSYSKLCFTVPEEVLNEKDDRIAGNIAFMRKLGFHVMLTGFGESGCPFVQLSELLVDYVMLSPSLTFSLGKSERSDQAIHSIISFINDLEAEPVADGVKTASQAEKFYSFGCNYCAGHLSGEYVSLSGLIGS